MVVLVAAVASYIFVHRSHPTSAPFARDSPAFQREYVKKNQARFNSKKKDREIIDVEKTQRKKDLELLKKQWLTLNERGENYEAAMELSAECARLLLASQESIDLILFLTEQEIGNGISREIQNLFASPHAADARRTLLELPDKQSEDGTNYRERWSGKAGMGCPEAEFEAFHAALGGGPCSQEALFGYYQNRVTVEPVETVRATLNELEKKVDSVTSRAIFSRLIKNLPDSAPFSEIEELLPKHYPNKPEISLEGTRMRLFKKWAAVDRQAAFDYLMVNSDRLGPPTDGACYLGVHERWYVGGDRMDSRNAGRSAF